MALLGAVTIFLVRLVLLDLLEYEHPRKIVRNETLCHETSRKRLQVMTENIDCSLMIKDSISYINGLVDLSSLPMPQALRTFLNIAPSSVKEFEKNWLRVEYSTENNLDYHYEERVFEMPAKLNRFMFATSKDENASDNSSFARELNSSDPLLKSSRIVLKRSNILEVYRGTFGYQPQNYGFTGEGGTPHHILELLLPRINGNGEQFLVHIPYREDQTTSSIFTAFVIYTTYSVMYELDSRDEMTLYDVMLRSQRLAYNLFAEAREWNGNSSKDSLLSEAMLKTAAQSLYDKTDDQHADRVRRKSLERVSSVIYWHRNESDYFMMLNLGAVRQIKPDETENSSFYLSDTTERSAPVSSSAGVIIMRKKFDGAPSQLIMAATASGSLRTVEAVSTVILRMLWLDEDPGAAVCASSLFHDYREGHCYCDNKCEHAEIGCLRVPEGDLEAQDRIVMAIRRRSANGDLTAAVDYRDPDFNYAVGY